ncbi:MAG: tryptophan synthase subunit alpha [Anaerolineae bacterium]
MNRIEETFVRLKGEGRAAVMPYLPLGYPTIETSQQLIRAAVEAGADLIELGIPFSDPLADGPVIQHATQIALENGMTLAQCLDMVRQARADGVSIPLTLMGYYNPILRYGLARFAGDAQTAGADGVIVPDLPPEEAGELKQACDRCGLHLIFLAAPTSTDERLNKIAQATSGFLYLVSLVGVTGAREALPSALAQFIQRTRAVTGKPLGVGFGIANAESARRVADLADGVIVGSALVARIADPATAVAQAHAFIAELRGAVE